MKQAVNGIVLLKTRDTDISWSNRLGGVMLFWNGYKILQYRDEVQESDHELLTLSQI